MILNDPVYILEALTYQPPRERALGNRAWWGYHKMIRQQAKADAELTGFELHPFWRIVMIGINTWVLVGLIGIIFGLGFWVTIAWGLLAMAVLAYMIIGIGLYIEMMGDWPYAG